MLYFCRSDRGLLHHFRTWDVHLYCTLMACGDVCLTFEKLKPLARWEESDIKYNSNI